MPCLASPFLLFYFDSPRFPTNLLCVTQRQFVAFLAPQTQSGSSSTFTSLAFLDISRSALVPWTLRPSRMRLPPPKSPSYSIGNSSLAPLVMENQFPSHHSSHISLIHFFWKLQFFKLRLFPGGSPGSPHPGGVS